MAADCRDGKFGIVLHLLCRRSTSDAILVQGQAYRHHDSGLRRVLDSGGCMQAPIR